MKKKYSLDYSVEGAGATLYNADCFEIMKELPPQSIDMILCDPPYGTTGELKWDTPFPLDELWIVYHRLIKPNGAILLFGQEPFTSKLILSNLTEFKYRWTWRKSKASNYLHAKQQPLRGTEDIAVFYKKQPTYNPQYTYAEPYNKGSEARLAPAYGARGRATEIKSEDGRRYPRTDIYFKTAESEGKTTHPTQKPIELLRYFIRTYTNKGDLILDNCAGSFSTGIAALLEGRNFIGIEKEEEYYARGLERFINLNLTNSIE